MANVDGDKPILRGLTPPRLPPSATPTALPAQPVMREALPLELTPVVTLDQSGALTAGTARQIETEAIENAQASPEPGARVAQEMPLDVEVDASGFETPPSATNVAAPPPEAAEAAPPAVRAPAAQQANPSEPDSVASPLASEDRTVITPIPPEADDYTNPTADAQILDSAPVHPGVPVRAAALGMSAIAARGQSPKLGEQLAQFIRKPVSFTTLQLGLMLLGCVVFGGAVTALATPKAAPAPVQAAVPTPPPPAPAPSPAPEPVPASAPAAEAVGAAPPEPKPAPRKRKAPKKLAGARLANGGKATR